MLKTILGLVGRHAATIAAAPSQRPRAIAPIATEPRVASQQGADRPGGQSLFSRMGLVDSEKGSTKQGEREDQPPGPIWGNAEVLPFDAETETLLVVYDDALGPPADIAFEASAKRAELIDLCAEGDILATFVKEDAEGAEIVVIGELAVAEMNTALDARRAAVFSQ